MNLYLDFGNTRLKWTLVDEWNLWNMSKNLIYDVHHCPVEDISHFINFIEQYEADITQATLAVTKLSRMSDDVINILDKYAISHYLIRPSHRVLTVNYHDSSTFGIDRYLGMVAVKHRLQEANDFCVVSAGTALTMDFVVSGKHIGGIISPGVGTQHAYLTQRTGLSNIKKPDTLLGNSTETSIGAGIYHGQALMVNSFIQQIEKNHDTKIKAYFTGGNADNLTKNNADIYPALIFLGMTGFNEVLADIEQQ